MPRTRIISDDSILDVALGIARSSGPETLTFASLASQVGLSGSTIVQRFGTKQRLLRAALVRAWDLLDQETSAAIGDASHESSGITELLVQLSGNYDARDFADQLLVLREDVRDPILRERGHDWLTVLANAIEDRLPGTHADVSGLGRTILAQWQGTLTLWSLTQHGSVREAVRSAIDDLLARIGLDNHDNEHQPDLGQQARPNSGNPHRDGEGD